MLNGSYKYPIVRSVSNNPELEGFIRIKNKEIKELEAALREMSIENKTLRENFNTLAKKKKGFF